MTPNPIRKVLLTLRSHRLRYLLMGGQACVFYGAAEFSRDADIAILAEPDNLRKLRKGLRELQAECIAVPPLSLEGIGAASTSCPQGETIEARREPSERERTTAVFGRRTDFPIRRFLLEGLANPSYGD